MAITKEQIFAVADELDAAGQNPTLASVRKQLGGGSFTTISEAMNEWRGRARKASRATTIHEPAPASITEKLAELGGDLWAVALEMANNHLAAEREALEAAVGTAKGEAEALREKLAAAGERAATAEARAGELRTELDRAHQEARQARGERDKAQEKAAAIADRVETLRADLATANSRATEIERRAGELRTELDRAHQDAAVAQAERDQARQEARQAREDAATLRGRVEALETVMAQEKGKTGGTKRPDIGRFSIKSGV